MKRLLLLLASAAYMMATTLTGTLNLPNGTGATGHLIFSLAQQAALVSAGGCGGPATLVPTTQISFAVVAGSFTGTPFLYGNDCMNPQGVYYNVQFVDANGNVQFTDRWQISGSSIDIGTIISVTIAGTTQTLGSTGVVLFSPVVNQTINQPPGTALAVNFFAVSGTFTFPSGASCNAAGCTGLDTGTVSLTGNQTISGIKTFVTAPVLASGLTLPILNMTGNILGTGSAASTNIGDAVTRWFNNGFFGGVVMANRIRMYQITGTPAAPSDYFDWENGYIHQFELVNSSAQNLLYIDDSRTLHPETTFQFLGDLFPMTGGAYSIGSSGLPWGQAFVNLLTTSGIVATPGGTTNALILNGVAIMQDGGGPLGNQLLLNSTTAGTSLKISNSYGGATGISVSMTNGNAGFFQTSNATDPAVTAENDGGGAGGGIALNIVGSVNSFGVEILSANRNLSNIKNITQQSGGATFLQTVAVQAIPSSPAGGGGLYVCIDTLGNTYKHASCP